MENKLSRIATFIESLPAEDSVGENQSTLLTTNIDAIGGVTKNGGNCENSIETNCDNSKNKGNCKNIGECADTDNGKDCKNLKNPDCIIGVNPSPSTPFT